MPRPQPIVLYQPKDTHLAETFGGIADVLTQDLQKRQTMQAADTMKQSALSALKNLGASPQDLDAVNQIAPGPQTLPFFQALSKATIESTMSRAEQERQRQQFMQGAEQGLTTTTPQAPIQLSQPSGLLQPRTIEQPAQTNPPPQGLLQRLGAIYTANPQAAGEALRTMTAPQSARSIDQLLAERVQSGQMTLDQALEAKKGEKKESAPTDYGTFYKAHQVKGETDAQISEAWHKQKVEENIKTAEARGASYSANRFYQVLDAGQGNRPRWVKGKDIDANPNRYISSSEGSKALTKETLIEDIRGNIINTRQVIQNPNLSFDTDMQAKIARLLTDRDPGSAISAFLDSKVGATLTSEQQDYLVKVQQLMENAMAMRSVLGAGAGSEDMRNAIKKTIPGPSTPSKQYALKQLDATEQTLNRLLRGVPQVTLRNIAGTQSTQTNTTGPQVGTVDSGYRFKGGDPADKNNWEKVQ